MANHYDVGVCILAGGQARRMDGKIKPLIEIAEKTILSHILDNIRQQTTGPVVLNVNSAPEQFAGYNLPLVEDVIPDFAGPLAGILTGLDWMSRQSPKPDYMLSLPGDAPLIPEDLVHKLMNSITETNSDVASVSSNNRTHPVIALWSLDLLEDLRTSVVEEHIRKIDRWTGRRKTIYVDWNTDAYDPFYNINRVEDLKGAEDILLNR